jgi:hypothetical protein
MIWTFLAQAVEQQQQTVTVQTPVWMNVGGILCGLTFALAISAVVCWLTYDALKALPPEFRKMDPPMVWLLMIPLFNLVWNFFVFQRVPESYANYFHSRGRTDVGDAGKTLGLWYAILAACSIIPCVGLFAGLASLVLLVLLLVKLTTLKNQIATAGPPGAFPTMPPSATTPPPPGYTPPPPGYTPPPPPPQA